MAATGKKEVLSTEVAHEIGDGFVVAWDTDAIPADLRDDLRKAAEDQIEQISHDLIAIQGDGILVVETKSPDPSPRSRRASRQAA